MNKRSLRSLISEQFVVRGLNWLVQVLLGIVIIKIFLFCNNTWLSLNFVRMQSLVEAPLLWLIVFNSGAMPIGSISILLRQVLIVLINHVWNILMEGLKIIKRILALILSTPTFYLILVALRTQMVFQTMLLNKFTFHCPLRLLSRKNLARIYFCIWNRQSSLKCWV